MEGPGVDDADEVAPAEVDHAEAHEADHDHHEGAGYKCWWGAVCCCGVMMVIWFW